MEYIEVDGKKAKEAVYGEYEPLVVKRRKVAKRDERMNPRITLGSERVEVVTLEGVITPRRNELVE